MIAHCPCHPGTANAYPRSVGEHYSDLVWEEFCHLAWLRIKATVNDSVREQAIRDEGNGSW